MLSEQIIIYGEREKFRRKVICEFGKTDLSDLKSDDVFREDKVSKMSKKRESAAKSISFMSNFQRETDRKQTQMLQKR